MTDCWVDTATYADLLACVFSTFLGWMPETTPCSWVFRCFSLLAWSCMLFLIPCVLCFQSASIKSLWPAFRTPHGSQDVQFLFAKLGTAKPGVLNYARNAHRSEVLIFRFSCFPVLYVLYDIYLCYFSFSGFISWWFGVLIRPVFNFAQGNGFFVHCSDAIAVFVVGQDDQRRKIHENAMRVFFSISFLFPLLFSIFSWTFLSGITLDWSIWHVNATANL